MKQGYLYNPKVGCIWVIFTDKQYEFIEDFYYKKRKYFKGFLSNFMGNAQIRFNAEEVGTTKEVLDKLYFEFRHWKIDPFLIND